ncbi:MAG: hypothetical protein ACTH30_01460 [Leucobacter sp.]
MKKHRAITVMFVAPLVLALTGCMGHLVNTLDDRNILIGTWTALELPGEPEIIFTDSPVLSQPSGERIYDGEVAFEGWPAAALSRDSTSPPLEMSWADRKDWGGQWRYDSGRVYLSVTEVDTDKHQADLAIVGGILDVFTPSFSPDCIDVYFSRNYDTGPTKLCRAS